MERKFPVKIEKNKPLQEYKTVCLTSKPDQGEEPNLKPTSLQHALLHSQPYHILIPLVYTSYRRRSRIVWLCLFYSEDHNKTLLQ